MPSLEPRKLRRAVFLDRDGTVNEEVHYLAQPDQLVLLPTVAETIARLNRNNIAVVVVTNQAGVARGYFPEQRLEAIHQRLQTLLEERGARLDGIFYCPHHPTSGLGTYKRNCDCRKPMPGMLTRAAEEFGLNLTQSLMIGDRESDLQAGAAAGCLTALVRTGYGRETSVALNQERVRGIGVFDSVQDAVGAWLAHDRQ